MQLYQYLLLNASPNIHTPFTFYVIISANPPGNLCLLMIRTHMRRHCLLKFIIDDMTIIPVFYFHSC